MSSRGHSLSVRRGERSVLEMSLSYKGWAYLDNGEKIGRRQRLLASFSFPLDVEGRYVIGSSDDSSISLLVPEFEAKDGETFPVEAALVVNGKGQVFAERPDGRNAVVLIDGYAMEKGTTSQQPLKFGSSVSFGGSRYVLREENGIFDDKMIQQSSELRRCHVCNDANREGLVILECGHNMCETCRRRIKEQINQFQNLPTPAQMQQLFGPVQVRDLLAIISSLQDHCSKCWMHVSYGAANSAISSLAMNQAAKSMSEFNEVESNRPLCDACHNKTGGLISSRDFHECRSCNQILCPPCVLKWHRNHDLKKRIDRLRDLDVVEQKLEEAKWTLHSLEQQLKDLQNDGDIILMRNNGGKQQCGIDSCLNSLEEKLAECNQILANIRSRKRELARGWDDMSEKMMDAFRRLGDEFRQLLRRVTEMCDAVVTSWLVESSRNEEDTTLALTNPESSTTTSSDV